MGGSSGGQASFQTPTPLYGAENNIFQPLPYPNTGGAAQNAYSGIGGINTQPSSAYGGTAYQNLFANIANQSPGAINAASQAFGAANQGYGAAGQAYAAAPGVMGQVQPYAQRALQTGFDPQNALYARNFAQNQNQANAVNAMSGVAGTPYGAGLTQQADTNFNLDWANQALQRQQTAAGTAANLYGAGTGAYTGLYGAGSSALGAGSGALGAGSGALGAAGNAATQGLAGAQGIYGFNNQQQQQQIADYLAYLQASTGNAAAYTGAVNQTTGAASGATNAINYGNQIGNQSTQGLGSLAGTIGGYLIAGA